MQIVGLFSHLTLIRRGGEGGKYPGSGRNEERGIIEIKWLKTHISWNLHLSFIIGRMKYKEIIKMAFDLLHKPWFWFC